MKMDEKMTRLLEDYVKKYDPEDIIRIVRKYFLKEYDFAADSMKWNEIYPGEIGRDICDETESSALMDMDKLLNPAMMAFCLAAFQWSKECSDKKRRKKGYYNIFYMMNGSSEPERSRGKRVVHMVLPTQAEEKQNFDMVKEFYRAVVAFYVGCRIARAYLKAVGRNFSEEQETMEAYEIAYDVLLKIIADSKGDRTALKGYTYLAPIMYLDFLDLIFYTERVMDKSNVYNRTHPIAKLQKEQLIGMCDLSKYDFDKTEGSRLYCGFVDVYDEYKVRLLFSKEDGKMQNPKEPII